MICCTVDIQKYDWVCKLYISVNGYKTDKILREVTELGASEKLVRRMEKSLRHNRVNTGFTYSNKLARTSVMVVGRSSSAKEEFNSVIHELRHLVDDIATTDNLQMGGEEVAYLSGDIAGIIYEHIAPLLCSHCRQK